MPLAVEAAERVRARQPPAEPACRAACVCHAPNLGAVPSQRAFSHLKGGFPRHRAAALFREAWDVST
eukprot:6410638-Prymnesium_polylepis.1